MWVVGIVALIAVGLGLGKRGAPNVGGPLNIHGARLGMTPAEVLRFAGKPKRTFDPLYGGTTWEYPCSVANGFCNVHFGSDGLVDDVQGVPLFRGSHPVAWLEQPPAALYGLLGPTSGCEWSPSRECQTLTWGSLSVLVCHGKIDGGFELSHPSQ
jgi:hypothetical protein